jgi:hypothetical protein
MRSLVVCLALTASVFVGCHGMPGFAPGAGGYDPVADGEKAKATFSGGDGSSIQQAVIISQTAGEDTGVRAEYVWLHEHYPGYRLQLQSLKSEGHKAYDVMMIRMADGKSLTIFFDITAFFGKY